MSDKAGRLPWLAKGLPLTLALTLAPPAHAQMGGMGPGMGGMGPGMGRPSSAGPHDKDEGPAEVAPDAEEKAPASAEGEVGYLNESRRRTKVVEFDGYFRTRTDYLYKMNLDQSYNSVSVPTFVTKKPFSRNVQNPRRSVGIASSSHVPPIGPRDRSSRGPRSINVRIRPRRTSVT